jgi:hypothetical protein
MAPHRGRRWLATTVLLLGISLPALAQVDERALKAAYLYNFLQFTQWPVPPEDPFRLCVLGSTPLDSEFARLSGKPVLGERRIAVRHVGTGDPLASCHALYVDDSQRNLVEEVLRRLDKAPVLTITDGDGLAERGLMIEIRKRELKLGFDVNLKVARRAQLNFSARMLKMASYVNGAAEAGSHPAPAMP